MWNVNYRSIKLLSKKIYEAIMPVPEPAGEAYTIEVLPAKHPAGSGGRYKSSNNLTIKTHTYGLRGGKSG